METSNTQPFRKSSWRLPARLFGLTLLLVVGPWLAGEFDKPSKAEAKQMRADTETVFGLKAVGRLRDSDHAALDFQREWERYVDRSSQAMKTHAQIDALYDTMDGQKGMPSMRSTQRQSAAEFLSNLPVDWPRPRSVLIPSSLIIVGLALLVASYRR